MRTKKESELSQLKTLDPRRKTALFTIMLSLFVIGFFAGIFFSVGRGKKTSIPFVPEQLLPPTPTPKPITTLILSPSAKVVSIGEILPVSVVLRGQRVQATDIAINFDPKYFTASDITAGDAFPILLRQNIEAGKVSVSASLDPENPVEPSSSLGEVFTMTLTALSATDSAIVDFDPQSTITAKDGVNTLALTVGGKYIIN